MAFNDFLKKAKETAANAASSAKNAAEAAKTKYSEKSSSWIATRQKRSVCGPKTRPRPTLKPMRLPKALQRPGAAHLLLKAASF